MSFDLLLSYREVEAVEVVGGAVPKYFEEAYLTRLNYCEKHGLPQFLLAYCEGGSNSSISEKVLDPQGS